MAKIISVKEAMEMIHDEMSIMIGGFLAVGTPEILVDALVEKNTKNHTLIAISTAYPNKGSGKLVVNKQVKKAIVSHIGTNPEAGKQYINGELEIEFVPQGTLVERIRCGGFGLGAAGGALGHRAARGSGWSVTGCGRIRALPRRGRAPSPRATRAPGCRRRRTRRWSVRCRAPACRTCSSS